MSAQRSKAANAHPAPAKSVDYSGVEETARPFVSAPPATGANPALAAALAEAQAAGLLDGGDKEHVSVRVPRALLAEARLRTGLVSATEVVTAGLALASQWDPFVVWMEANRGKLGKDFQLDY